MMTLDRILYFASSHHGVAVNEDASRHTTDKITALVAEGILERREKIAHLDAVRGEAAEHYRDFGWPTEARDITIVTFHLTEKGRDVWARGSRKT